MSIEQMQGNHELGEEKNREQLEHERAHKLDKLEQRSEHEAASPEHRAEKAREVINKQEQAPQPPFPPEAAPKAPNAFLLNHKLNYTETLMAVQRKLSPISRGFSQIIHAPVVEKTSEALEKTVARPSVTAGAAWTALIIGSIFYLTARRYGYSLSGAEILFSFVVGAFIGLLLEGVWRTFFRRHQ